MGLFRPNIIKLEEQRDIDGLMKAMSHKDAEIRRGAAAALGNLDVKDASKILSLAVQYDGDEGVRAASLSSLGKLDPVNKLGMILNIAMDASVGKLSEAASGVIEAIALRTPDLILRECHKPMTPSGSNRSSRFTALDKLDFFIKLVGKMGKQMGPVLMPLLNDPNAEIRRNAAMALGEIGDDRANARLRELLEDPGGLFVQKAAARALMATGYRAQDFDERIKLYTRGMKEDSAIEAELLTAPEMTPAKAGSILRELVETPLVWRSIIPKLLKRIDSQEELMALAMSCHSTWPPSEGDTPFAIARKIKTFLPVLKMYRDAAEDRPWTVLESVPQSAAFQDERFSDFDMAYYRASGPVRTNGIPGDWNRALLETGLDKSRRKSILLFALAADAAFREDPFLPWLRSVQAFWAADTPPRGPGDHVYAYLFLFYAYEGHQDAGTPPITSLIAMNNPGIEIPAAWAQKLKNAARIAGQAFEKRVMDEAASILRERLPAKPGPMKKYPAVY